MDVIRKTPRAIVTINSHGDEKPCFCQASNIGLTIADVKAGEIIADMKVGEISY